MTRGTLAALFAAAMIVGSTVFVAVQQTAWSERSPLEPTFIGSTGAESVYVEIDLARDTAKAKHAGDPVRQDVIDTLAVGLKDGVPEGLPIPATARLDLVHAHAAAVFAAVDDADAVAVKPENAPHLGATAAGSMAALLDVDLAAHGADTLATAHVLETGRFRGVIEAFSTTVSEAPVERYETYSYAFAKEVVEDVERHGASVSAVAGAPYAGAVTAWAAEVGRETVVRVPYDAGSAQAEWLGELGAAVVTGGLVGYVEAAPADPAVTLPDALTGVAAGLVDGASDAFLANPGATVADAWANVLWLEAVTTEIVVAASSPDLSPTTNAATLWSGWAEGLAAGFLSEDALDPLADYEATYTPRVNALAGDLVGDALTVLASAETAGPRSREAAVAYAAALSAGVPHVTAMPDAVYPIGRAYLEGLAGAVTAVPDAAGAGALGTIIGTATETGLARITATSEAAWAVAGTAPVDALAGGLVDAVLSVEPYTPDSAFDQAAWEAFVDGLVTGYVDDDNVLAWPGHSWEHAHAAHALVSQAVTGFAGSAPAQGAYDAARENGNRVIAAVNAFSQSAGGAVTAWAFDGSDAMLVQTGLMETWMQETSDAIVAWSPTAPPLPGNGVVPWVQTHVAPLTDYAGAVADAARATGELEAWAHVGANGVPATDQGPAEYRAFRDATVAGALWIMDDENPHYAPGLYSDQTQAAIGFVTKLPEYKDRFDEEGYVPALVTAVGGMMPALAPPADASVAELERQSPLVQAWFDGVVAAVANMDSPPAEATLGFWVTWGLATTGAARDATVQGTEEQLAHAEEYAQALTAYVIESDPVDPGAVTLPPLARGVAPLVTEPLGHTMEAGSEQAWASYAWLQGTAVALVDHLVATPLPPSAAVTEEVAAYVAGVADAAGEFSESVQPSPCPEDAECGPSTPEEWETWLTNVRAAAAAFSARAIEATLEGPGVRYVDAWSGGAVTGIAAHAEWYHAVSEERLTLVAGTLGEGPGYLPTGEDADHYGTHAADVMTAYAMAVASGAMGALVIEVDEPTEAPDAPAGTTPPDPDTYDTTSDWLRAWLAAMQDALYVPEVPEMPDVDLGVVDNQLPFLAAVVTGGSGAALEAVDPAVTNEQARAAVLAAWAEALVGATQGAALDQAADSERVAAYLHGLAAGAVTDAPHVAEAQTDAVAALATALADPAWIPEAPLPEPRDDGDDPDPAEPWLTYGQALAGAVTDLPSDASAAYVLAVADHVAAVQGGLTTPPAEPTEAYLATLDAWLRAEAGALLEPPLPGEGDVTADPDPDVAVAFLTEFTPTLLWQIPATPPTAGTRDFAMHVASGVRGMTHATCEAAEAGACDVEAGIVGAAFAEALGALANDGNAEAPDEPEDDGNTGSGMGAVLPATLHALETWEPGASLREEVARQATTAVVENALASDPDVSPTESARAAYAALVAAGEAGTVTPDATVVAAVAGALADLLLDEADAGSLPSDVDADAVAAAVVTAHALADAAATDQATLESKARAHLEEHLQGGHDAMDGVFVTVTDGTRVLRGAHLDGDGAWLATGDGHVFTVFVPRALRDAPWSIEWDARSHTGEVLASGTLALDATTHPYTATLAVDDLSAWEDGARVTFQPVGSGNASVHHENDPDGRTYTYAFDRAAPRVTVDAGPLSQDASFPVRWNAYDEHGSGVKHVTVAHRQGDGAWEVLLPRTTDASLTFSGAPGEWHHFRACALDDAGYEGCSDVTSLHVQGVESGANRPPSVAFTAPADGVTLTGSAGIRLALDDPDGTEPFAHVAVYDARKGGHVDDLLAEGAGLFRFDATEYPDGLYRLRAVASDGRTNRVSEITVTLDTTPPRVLGLRSWIDEGGQAVVTARLPDAAAAWLTPRGGTLDVALADDGTGVDAVAGDGVWSAALPAPTEGVLAYALLAEDAAGNVALSTGTVAPTPPPSEDAEPAPGEEAPDEEAKDPPEPSKEKPPAKKDADEDGKTTTNEESGDGKKSRLLPAPGMLPVVALALALALVTGRRRRAGKRDP